MTDPSPFDLPERREPAFNVPAVVVALGAVLIAIHLVRYHVLSVPADNEVLVLFAFWPVRYVPEVLASGSAPGGLAADAWGFLSYAFLHGGTAHVLFNLLWMATFGSALARRFGTARFLAFSALCAIGGAAAHLATHFGEAVPMIGASAAVSGQMAGALRFVFELGGPLGAIRRTDPGAYRIPAVPLLRSLTNPQVFGFMAVWFGINLLFGLWSAPLTGEDASIAWQAHIGGFLAGLALFPLFDPVRRW
ncbi:rhomboid family intramembrane serine protease [Polymorphum gilvum]|nr:rhomboid family intramembrane serine protease [Polymorphum gilvum]